MYVKLKYRARTGYTLADDDDHGKGLTWVKLPDDWSVLKVVDTAYIMGAGVPVDVRELANVDGAPVMPDGTRLTVVSRLTAPRQYKAGKPNDIAKVRRSLGLTQQQVAERMGVGQCMIASWENGRRVPKLETLVRLADAMDCDVGLLIPEERVTPGE